jgi:hypothetical protein
MRPCPPGRQACIKSRTLLAGCCMPSILCPAGLLAAVMCGCACALLLYMYACCLAGPLLCVCGQHANTPTRAGSLS